MSCSTVLNFPFNIGLLDQIQAGEFEWGWSRKMQDGRAGLETPAIMYEIQASNFLHSK